MSQCVGLVNSAKLGHTDVINGMGMNGQILSQLTQS